MLNDKETFRDLIATVIGLLNAENNSQLGEIVKHAAVSIAASHMDEWGDQYYNVHITTDTESYTSLGKDVSNNENYLLQKFQAVCRRYPSEDVGTVIITPIVKNKIDWSNLSGITTKEELISDVKKLMSIMTQVATGLGRLQEVQELYGKLYGRVSVYLDKLSLTNPNPYSDIWDWYGKWKSDLPTYQERRNYISKIYNQLLRRLEETVKPGIIKVFIDLEGWSLIKRNIAEVEVRSNNLTTEEQCQSIGLLCRETIISLAQTVYDIELHPSTDGVTISKTDAKRMLEAYISVEFKGSSNELLRKYAKSTLDLANALTHKRTADKRDALLCKAATLALINLIGVVEGKF